MYPRLFYSRLKFFFLQFNRCFETTNNFLQKHFSNYYQAPPKKKMIRVPNRISKKKENWRDYQSDYSNRFCYFDKKIPELDKLNSKELTMEFLSVRKSLMDRSKILYLYKRSISSAKISQKNCQVKITRLED